jgi:hypothetical protein
MVDGWLCRYICGEKMRNIRACLVTIVFFFELKFYLSFIQLFFLILSQVF